jgi:hypothetical protein
MSSDSDNNGISDDDDNVDAEEDDVILLNGDRLAVNAAQKLVTDNPLRLFTLSCKGKVKGTADRGAVVDYLESLFSLPHCFSKHSNRFEQCSCLINVRENVVIEVIADHLSKCYFC